MSKVLRFAAFIFVTQLFTGLMAAHAQTSTTREEFYIDLYPSRDYQSSTSTTAGEIEYFKAVYTPAAKKFHLYVVMKPHPWQTGLANGFEFEFTDGMMPHSWGHVPRVYVDARNQAAPVVMAYVNGNSNDSWKNGSYDDLENPEGIVSSLNDSSFVESISVVNGDAGRRIFDLVLNTTVIDNYTRRHSWYPWSWDGLKFGHHMGIWFNPAYITSATYNLTSSPVTYNGYQYQPGFYKKYYRSLGYLDISMVVAVDCHGNPRVQCDCYGNNCQYVPGDTYDECGVCGGDNSTCADCAGTPNGNAVVDQCGVCNGNGTSCLDCAGVPNGGAQLDLCQVCVPAGQPMNLCLDCAGTPNGTAKTDLCGVCGGDNSTCSDCAGTPNGTAIPDACGVCGGDGSTCAPCVTTNNGASILALDGLSIKFQAAVSAGIKGLSRYDRSSSALKYAKATLAKARALHVEGWTVANTFPTTTLACGVNVTTCSVQSLSTTIVDYNNITVKFNSVIKDVVKKLNALSKRLSGKNKTAVKNSAIKLSKTATALVLQTTNITKALPTTTCR